MIAVEIGSSASGDKLEGASCNGETEITKIVRLDQSGTTHVFKRYLGLINKTGTFETEKAETKTWNEIAEGTENTTWPKAGKTEKPLAKGGGEVVAKVAATPSSIGYANLADVRATKASARLQRVAPEQVISGAELENSGTTTTTPTYAEAATNGDVEATANSNCEKEKYTNGSGTKFPPENTAKVWSSVTTSTKEPKYTICGITYYMGLSHYYRSKDGAARFLRFVSDVASSSRTRHWPA
jgi:ABC-type phosphate transport system substrate-binding protein